MRRISRREFTKLAGGAALAVPLAASLAWPQETKPTPAKPPETPQPPTAPAKPEAKLKLATEQEEAVKQAVERRDRQLAGLRSRVLAYDAEPAFVFQVRQRPRAGRR